MREVIMKIKAPRGECTLYAPDKSTAEVTKLLYGYYERQATCIKAFMEQHNETVRF